MTHQDRIRGDHPEILFAEIEGLSMPAIGSLLFLLDVLLIVHAAKSGRFWPWAYVVLLLPGFGAAAYVLVELLPAWRGSASGRKTERQIAKALDPTKRYRALKEAAEVAETIANRAALAEECLAIGEPDEAVALFSGIVDEPHGDEPMFFTGKARGELALGRPDQALATLDELKRRWPDYNQAEAHLVYARSLDEAGRSDEAEKEYRALANSYPGLEPTLRLAHLLKQDGRRTEALSIAAEVVKRGDRSPPFVRKRNARWLAEARKLLKG
jgi:hypothetical protein